MSLYKRPTVYNKEKLGLTVTIPWLNVNVSTVLATALLSLAVGQKKHCAIKPQSCLWGLSARQVCC